MGMKETTVNVGGYSIQTRTLDRTTYCECPLFALPSQVLNDHDDSLPSFIFRPLSLRLTV